MSVWDHITQVRHHLLRALQVCVLIRCCVSSGQRASGERDGSRDTDQSQLLFLPSISSSSSVGLSGKTDTIMFIDLIIIDEIFSADSVPLSEGLCDLHPSSSSSSRRRCHLQHVDVVVHVWLPHGQLHGQSQPIDCQQNLKQWFKCFKEKL